MTHTLVSEIWIVIKQRRSVEEEFIKAFWINTSNTEDEGEEEDRNYFL